MKSIVYKLLKATLATLFIMTFITQVHAEPNELTNTEKEQGWKLLFDGKTLDGWHVFKHKDAKPAWQVQSGTLL